MIKKRFKGKSFWAGTFTLTGCIIGAGILGLPYLFSQSGFLIGLFWIIFLGLIIILTNLYMGEVILRTSGNHQLTGYAGHYLGKTGEKLMFFAMIFGIYSALLAYLIGEGQSLSYFFTGGEKYALLFGIVFWAIMTLLLREGLRGLKKVESWGVIAIIIMALAIFIMLFPKIDYGNISHYNTSLFFLPMGVVLFALLGFSAIPEVGRVMEYSKNKLMKALIIGSLIPIFIYFLFTFAFVGAFGDKIKEVATISAGSFGSLFGIFTMLTSYFVLSFSLRDMFNTDFHVNKKYIFFIVSIIPILLYLFIVFFNIFDFEKILGIGGVISGGLTAILILLMNYQSKKYSERKPEYWIPINWIIILILAIVFIAGIVIELGLFNLF
jgi:amino acid permease